MADVVDPALRSGEDWIAREDILGILPTGDLAYRVLFFDSDHTRLKTVDIPTLPSELSSLLVTDLPAHLQHDLLQVVISTRSGTGTAAAVFSDLVQPFLASLGRDYEVYETETENTIPELARTKFLERACQGIAQTIVLLTGDGGLVDLVDVFYKSDRTVSVPPTIALIPCGTGNAMASSIGFRSGPMSGLPALLRGQPSSLPVFAAQFSPGSRLVIDEGRDRARIDDSHLYGAVVASWGFHAALVADSDTAEYRAFGAQRFQMAAQELLYPSDGSVPHAFRGRITLTTPKGGQEALPDPEHMYVLATLVPRLEKEFLISPDSEALSGQMKLIRFGPLSADQAMSLMTRAYQGGQHVQDDTVTYAEVEGLRIDFQEDEERWRRVCIDGKIVAVEQNGWMAVRKESRGMLEVLRVL
ncbi:uncharacterized protein PFLUO_LOCUS852 [Penicillium psychrofluorescens]|uniref:uncharacterized protein n=1 Tax=Penicillium psychrofluorescens TaxID=3158075 RepID=UPI003CCCD9B3